MFNVVSEKKWERFCAVHELPVENALFALNTCYYRLDLRSRPGTLILTDVDLIHCSYSIRDTIYAMFEKSQTVRIPLTNIAFISKVILTTFQKSIHADPDSAFHILMQSGESHDLALQSQGSEFLEAMKALGVPVSE